MSEKLDCYQDECIVIILQILQKSHNWFSETVWGSLRLKAVMRLALKIDPCHSPSPEFPSKVCGVGWWVGLNIHPTACFLHDFGFAFIYRFLLKSKKGDFFLYIIVRDSESFFTEMVAICLFCSISISICFQDVSSQFIIYFFLNEVWLLSP